MSHAANDDEAHINIIKSGISPVTCSLSSQNIIITINIVFSVTMENLSRTYEKRMGTYTHE